MCAKSQAWSYLTQTTSVGGILNSRPVFASLVFLFFQLQKREAAVAVRRVCVCVQMLQRMIVLLCGIIVWRGEGERAKYCGGQGRKQTTSDGTTRWSISLLCCQKIDREKWECNRATFRSVNKKLYSSSSDAKVARLHASKFGNVQGKCFHICWSFCCFRSSIIYTQTTLVFNFLRHLGDNFHIHTTYATGTHTKTYSHRTSS